MKKKIIVLALLATLLSGCGSKIPTLSNGDEAVVTLKNDSMISTNELYEAVKKDYALEKMISLVDKKILEDKYKDKIEEAKKANETSISQLQAAYGEQLEDVLRQNGFASIESYKEASYLSQLRNFAIEDYAKAQISKKEVEKYYKDEVVGDIKISHILVSPKVKDSMTDDEKKKAETEAKEKAEAIIAELNKKTKTKGKISVEKFAEEAKAKSMDDSTKENGGSLGFINKDTLSPEYKEVVEAAYKLKDGEYTTKVVTSELGYHIIYRADTKEKAKLEDIKDDIVEKLAEKYLTKHQIASVKALQELRKEYKFEIVDTELQSQYAKYIQDSLNYFQQVDNQAQAEAQKK